MTFSSNMRKGTISGTNYNSGEKYEFFYVVVFF